MKKYIKIILSALLAVSVAVTPVYVAAPSVNNEKTLSEPVSENTVEKITEEKAVGKEKTVEAKTEMPDNKTVTISENTINELQTADDKVYEPEQESITELDDSSAYINDSFSVFFKEGATEEEKQAVVDSVDGEIVGEVSFINQYEVKIQRSELEEINSVCDKVMENECVEFASCTLAGRIEENSIPDDPWGYYADWSDSANFTNRSYNNWWIKAIDADKAWDYKDKFSHIKIGIVDSGFDTGHEDLQGKFTFPSRYFERHNAPGYHGTHVAGIIAANHDNGVGISGVVDDCELVCVDWKADTEQNQYWASNLRIMTGFINAVRSGAKVINFSLGSKKIINGTTDKYKIIKDIEGKFFSYIMAKMLQKGYDFIVCQSAGNGTELKNGESYAVDASNNGTFCTVTKENAANFVIGVKPQDILDRIIIVASAAFGGWNNYYQSSFSNGGSQVSICAPGSSIYSTYYDEEDESHDYAYLSGTSMATPIVTGVTSLVWSVNQSFTGAQVKHFVCDIENTKYMVKDSLSETHLPEGEIPMVNAQLAVEAALKANGDTGIVEGEIVALDNSMKIEIVNNETDEVYRILPEDGKFTAQLPEGEYTVKNVGDIEYDELFSVVKGETTELEAFCPVGFNTDVSAITKIITETVLDNM